MTLKLYGLAASRNVRRVTVVLHEKKIPFEFITVDLSKGEHKQPAFLEKQPFGQIPYIDDDGFILYESRAIGLYLATKYADQGPKLIPTDLKERAIFEQAASVEVSAFDPPAFKAVFEGFMKPSKTGLPIDKAIFDAAISKTESVLDVYEAFLAKHKYIAGDELTLVDLFHLPVGERLQDAGSKILYDESRPHVVRWWKDISTRESWRLIRKDVVIPPT